MNFNQISFVIFSLLYSLYGSPTTSKIGVVEVAMIILIIASINITNFVEFIQNNYKDKLLIFFSIVLIYGFFISMYQANSLNKVLRDFIFYGYMGYFFLMLFLIERSKFDLKVVLFFLIITGVFFLIRSYYTSISLHYDFTNLVIDKRYLIINISILFVSTLLPLILIKFFLKKKVDRVFIFIFSIIFIYAYLFFSTKLAIRSSLLVFFGLSLYLIVYLYRKKYLNDEYQKNNIVNKIGITIIVILISFILYNLELTEIFFKLKSNFFNNRLFEFRAAYENLVSPFDIIFGKGVGSLILSKSTNGYTNFVHNFFLHFYYKHGIIGLIFSIILMYKISIRIYFNIINLNPIAIAGFFPFIYALMLSTSYKTLEFWMLVIVMIISEKRKFYVHKNN
tara:strand:- start:933 stop:2114 length:1182 start_codon:yes stop_codon:yes gene_type:complete